MESGPEQLHPQPQTPFALPRRMPVMILSNCFLMPGCFLPLFIFEQRYREMLRQALRTDRMFCVGIRKRVTCDREDILPVTTAGLIRACVHNEDGTSQLMLYGVQRIRIAGWVQEAPFRIAEIEPVETLPFEESRVSALQQQAVQLLPPAPENPCDTVKIIRQAIECIHDPELACDILAYHFVKRAFALKTLLTERCLVKRYATLISELKRSGGHAESDG